MELMKKCRQILRRNQYILNYEDIPAKKNQINLNWCDLRRKDGLQNFGDYLAVPIFDYMCRYYNLNPEQKVRKTKHLYTVGSILLFGRQDATIWGSGILFSEPPGYRWKTAGYRKLEICCVRGPNTKKRLMENGYDVHQTVMGDPGVLMPLVYPVKPRDEHEYGVISHMKFQNKDLQEYEINILTDDWAYTIDEILGCKKIISSSLHGIIIAEAYGIPAVLCGNIENHDLFKYDDYYHSTGRENYPVCKDVEEALKVTPAKLPDVSDLQKNLIESFPVHLWEEERRSRYDRT